MEDLGLIPELGRSPGDRKGYPLQYSGLENSIDCIGHGVLKGWTQLSDFHCKAPLAVLNRSLGFMKMIHAEHFLPIKYSFAALLEIKNIVWSFLHYHNSC